MQSVGQGCRPCQSLYSAYLGSNTQTPNCPEDSLCAGSPWAWRVEHPRVKEDKALGDAVGRWFQEDEQHRQQSGGLGFCSERPRTRGRGGGRTFGPKRGAPWGTRSPCGLQNRVLHASGLLCAPREPTVQVAPGAEGRLGSVCTTLTGPPARSGAAPRLPRHPCRSLLGEHSMAWKGGADRLITSPVGRPGGQGLWFPRGRHFPAT